MAVVVDVLDDSLDYSDAVVVAAVVPVLLLQLL